jgi:hypothetical protein
MKKIDVSNVRIPGTNLQGGRAIAVGALALYGLLFIVLNDRKLKVDFVFFSLQSNELLALVLILGLGFAAGFIARGRTQPGRVIEAQPPPPPLPALEAATESIQAPEPAGSGRDDAGD